MDETELALHFITSSMLWRIEEQFRTVTSRPSKLNEMNNATIWREDSIHLKLQQEHIQRFPQP